MCLDKITRTIGNPSRKQYAAWKVFYVPVRAPLVNDGIGDELCFSHKKLGDSTRVPTDRWIKAEEVPLLANSNRSPYKSGFHVYRTRKDADWARLYSSIIFTYRASSCYALVRVAVRRIAYVGRQDGRTVLVAREMFVKKGGV